MDCREYACTNLFFEEVSGSVRRGARGGGTLLAPSLTSASRVGRGYVGRLGALTTEALEPAVVGM